MKEFVHRLAEWARKLHGYDDDSEYTKGYNQAIEDVKKSFFEQLYDIEYYED